MSIKILSEARSNGSRGPIPVQVDWLDHRWRSAVGTSSDAIPFQRPGWVSPRHWEAFRKAIERKSSFTEIVPVLPTLVSLRRYIRHLEADQQAEAVAQIKVTGKLFTAPANPEEEPQEEQILLRGLSEQGLKQHAFYRARGWQPWIWTEERGTNIVLLLKHQKQFTKWQRSRKSLEAKRKEEEG